MDLYQQVKQQRSQIRQLCTDANSCYEVAFARHQVPEPHLVTKAQTWWWSVKEHFTDESGAVATEYALLLLLIALVIVTAATALGLAIKDKFSNACTQLQGSNC